MNKKHQTTIKHGKTKPKNPKILNEEQKRPKITNKK